MIRTLFLVTLVAIASAAQACLWDRDTLADQVKDAKDVVWAITGRFERNPPLYYEIRLGRVAEELTSEPSRLAARVRGTSAA